MEASPVDPDAAWLMWPDRMDHRVTYTLDLIFTDGSQTRIAVDYYDGSTESGLQIPLALFERF